MKMPKAVKIAPNVAKKMIANLQATISMLQEVPANQFDRTRWALVANELDRCATVAGTMNSSTELDNDDFLADTKERFNELQGDPDELHFPTEDPDEDTDDISDDGDDDGFLGDAGDGPPEIGDSGFPIGR